MAYQQFETEQGKQPMDSEAGNRWKLDLADHESSGPMIKPGHQVQSELQPLVNEPALHPARQPQQDHQPQQDQQLHPPQDLEPGNNRAGSISSLILANSWIVSLAFHLGVLLLLSLISYTLHRGGALELELANSPADDTTFMLEADDSDASDGKNLDNEMEQLLAASEQTAVFEVNSDPFEFDAEFSLENMDGMDTTSSDAESGLINSDRKVGNGNQAQFFGIQASGKSFVFIVDSSGSMTGARWKNAVAELRTSLQALQENQKFYVIFFDHQTHLMFQGRVDRYRKSRSLNMVNATKENLTRVNNWLRRVDLGKQTRPRVSFDYGMSLAPDAIFFLTDGEFNDGTYEHLMGIAAQSSESPIIHTVAFGNRSAGKALEEIAERFRGKYRFVR